MNLNKPKTVRAIFSKRYYVYCNEELVLHTDSWQKATKLVNQLKLKEERSIQFVDNDKPEYTWWTKEPEQRNYRKTTYSGIPKQQPKNQNDD